MTDFHWDEAKKKYFEKKQKKQQKKTTKICQYFFMKISWIVPCVNGID